MGWFRPLVFETIHFTDTDMPLRIYTDTWLKVLTDTKTSLGSHTDTDTNMLEDFNRILMRSILLIFYRLHVVYR